MNDKTNKILGLQFAINLKSISLKNDIASLKLDLKKLKKDSQLYAFIKGQIKAKEDFLDYCNKWSK